MWRWSVSQMGGLFPFPWAPCHPTSKPAAIPRLKQIYIQNYHRQPISHPSRLQHLPSQQSPIPLRLQAWSLLLWQPHASPCSCLVPLACFPPPCVECTQSRARSDFQHPASRPPTHTGMPLLLRAPFPMETKRWGLHQPSLVQVLPGPSLLPLPCHVTSLLLLPLYPATSLLHPSRT